MTFISPGPAVRWIQEAVEKFAISHNMVPRKPYKTIWAKLLHAT